MTGAPPGGEIARLWDEVAASPDDDSVRAVLADLLLGAGDPRGELISLQLLSAEEEAATARQERIQQLMRDHAAAWLGPIRDVVRAARFDRGFLDAFEIVQAWSIKNARWEIPLASRTLLTVRELPQPLWSSPVPDRERDRGAIYARFVTSPAMAALRRIAVFDPASIAALEACAAPLSHVACMLRTSDTEGALVGKRIVPVCARRAEITSLAIFADVFPLIAACRWFDRLSAITVACGARRGLELWPRVPSGARLIVAPSPEIEPCSVAYPWDYRIELAREDGQVTARIAGEWVLQPLLALAALPREVSRIEIEHTSALMARRVGEAVARPGVEVITRPPRRAGNIRWI
jgi:uncharacterized protein (TIGR02996 family)